MTTRPIRGVSYRIDTAGPLPTLIVGGGQRRVVWLHGLGWSPLASLGLLLCLARTHGLTIYAPVLPNHGAACDATTYDEYAAQLNQWAHYHGIREDLWIGYSVGGYTITELAIRYPELVSALVTLAAPIAAPFDTRPIADLEATVFRLHKEAALHAPQGVLLAMQRGCGLLFLRSLLALARQRTRYGNAMQVIQSSRVLDRAMLEGLASRLGWQRIIHVYAGDDAVVQTPRTQLPGRQIVVPGAHHSFLAVVPSRAVVEAVTHAVARALGIPSQYAIPVSQAGAVAPIAATPAQAA